MQTIMTKYYGPTNYRSARVAAWNSSKTRKIWLDYDYSLEDDENHTKAARWLKERLGWRGIWVGGHTLDGMVFVCTETRNKLGKELK